MLNFIPLKALLGIPKFVSSRIFDISKRGRSTKLKLLGFMLLFSLLILDSNYLFATHFRYGTVTWRVTTGSTVEFTLTTSWRSDFIGVGFLNSGVGSSRATQISNIVVSNAGGVATRVQKFLYNYPHNGPFRANFTSCCRILGLSNGTNNTEWDVFTIVNLSDGNKNSPVSSLPPIVNIPENAANASFQVPANDLDGDDLSFRLATNNELGRGSSLPPGLSIDANTGEVTVNTNLTTYNNGQLWFAGVVISDGKASTLIDFLMQITPQSTPPEFLYGPTPTNGTIIQRAPGQPVNFQVRARDIDPGGTITSLLATGIPTGASFPVTLGQTANGTFSWTPTAADFGSKVINFIAQDNIGVQSSSSVVIQVSLKPVFDIPPTPNQLIIVEPGTNINHTIQASDPDPLDVVKIISTSPLPTGASLTSPLPTATGNPISLGFNWTPTVSQWGFTNITYTAEDGYGDQATHEVQMLVNTTPVITSPPPTQIVAGQTYNYNFISVDPDLQFGDVLTIIAPGIPTWLSLIDNGDGTALLTGTPTVSDGGIIPIDIHAHDINHHTNVGGMAMQSFSLEVIPCVVDAFASSISLDLDADGNLVLDPLQIDNNSTVSCGIPSLSVTPNTFDCTNIGPNTVTLTVTDINNISATTTAVVTINDNTNPLAVAQNVTVQLDAAGNGSTTAGDVNNGSSDACGIALLSVSPSSFTCNEVGANTVTLTVTDNNGNVSTATAVATVEDNVAPAAVAQNVTVQLDASGNGTTTAGDVYNGSSDACGIASLSVSPSSFTCNEVGANTVTLTVTDNNGNVSTATAVATVEDNVAPAAVAQNVTVQLDAAGNGSTTADDVNNGSSDACGIASLSVSPSSFTCGEVGANTVTLTVTDNNGNVSTATAVATVEDNVAPVAVAQNVTVQLDASGNGSTTAADVNNGSSDACGIASLSVSPSSFTCSEVGGNTVTLTVTDNNGNVSTATAVVTVEDNVPPVAVAQNMTVQLDALGSASITVAEIDNGSNDACGIYDLSLDIISFDCSDVGANTVTLTAVDVNGNSSSATAIVTVLNDLPEINSLILPSDPQEINTTVNASATFTDINPASAMFDWGDGTTSAGVIGSGTIEGSHEYLSSDLNTVTLTLTDICGETGQTSYQYVVVTDKNDGRVHGDGEVWSDIGNYLYNPTKDGKAKFKFDTEYKKHHHHEKGHKQGKKGHEHEYEYELKGKTEFKFKDGKLDFKSTSYDWLVVTEDRAIFKGSGKINKIAGYDFIVSVLVREEKKDKDKFRIKIWTDGGVVVYDNQMGADTDDEALAAISKGKIHIHKAKKDKKDKKNARIASDLALADEIQELTVDVYPNPFQNTFIVKYEGYQGVNDVTLTMIDISGRSVFTKSFNPEYQHELSIDFDGQHIKEGLYFIHLNDGIESKIFKLIKK